MPDSIRARFESRAGAPPSIKFVNQSRRRGSVNAGFCIFFHMGNLSNMRNLRKL